MLFVGFPGSRKEEVLNRPPPGSQTAFGFRTSKQNVSRASCRTTPPPPARAFASLPAEKRVSSRRMPLFTVDLKSPPPLLVHLFRPPLSGGWLGWFSPPRDEPPSTFPRLSGPHPLIGAKPSVGPHSVGPAGGRRTSFSPARFSRSSRGFSNQVLRRARIVFEVLFPFRASLSRDFLSLRLASRRSVARHVL